MPSSFSRRDALRYAGGALMTGSALSACTFLSTDPDKKAVAKSAPVAAKESPMLTDLVRQGKLPALAKRLPKNPLVVKPLTEAGRFGGTLRMGQPAPPGGIITIRALGRSGLAEWNLETTAPQPGLASSWDIADDGRTFVFHLREGLKWSDGKPFNADDFMFWYENIILNKTFVPNPDIGWMAPGGKHVVVEKSDDHTVTFRFAARNGLLTKFLCFPDLALGILTPRHYLSQFHPDFVDEAKLTKQAKSEGYTTWLDLFGAKSDMWLNPDRPVLGAWKISKPAKSGNTAEAERNPYYWKVDPDGRQLPYIDKISWFFVDLQTLVLRAANGDMDLGTANLTYEHMPVLLRTAQSKGYKVYRWTTDAGLPSISLNQNHSDPVIHELFANLDFRAALSHAINRDDINEARYAGQGIPRHPVSQPGDPYYLDELGKRFIEYDVEEANRRLDAVGLTKRDSAGFRLRPDGKKLRLEMMTQSPELVEIYELVRRHWAKVGINAFVHSISGELFNQRLPQAKYDIAATTTETYDWDLAPGSVVPLGANAFWAPLYGLWYGTAGKEGVKPTGDIRQLQVLYDKLVAETDDAKRLDLGQQILRLHDKNVWIIGTVMTPTNPMVVNADLVNVRKTGVGSYYVGVEEATLVEQVFYKSAQKG